MERYRDGDPKRESKRTERETRRDEYRGKFREIIRTETKRRPERVQRVGGKRLGKRLQVGMDQLPRLDQAEVRQR